MNRQRVLKRTNYIRGEYMIKILFASNNKKKFDELEKDFADVGIELCFSEQKLILPETSATSLNDNAITKARAAAEQTGMIALGDDSGVFIEELDYCPGVFSRRWLTELEDGTIVPEGSDGDMMRNHAILKKLEGLPAERRLAHLISRFALVTPEGDVLARTFSKNTFYIAEEPKVGGNGAFGYDPILIKKPNVNDGEEQFKLECKYLGEGLTIGCLSQEEKNFINNRGGQIRNDIKVALENYNK